MFPPILPEGFWSQPEFLTAREEANLLRSITNEHLQPLAFHRYTARRRTLEFGLHYNLDNHTASPARAFPEYLVWVRERAAGVAGIHPADVVEGIIIEYPPGAPIGWHRDAPQFGTVIGISLGHAARMRLRPYRPKRDGSKSAVNSGSIAITLEPRSIYVLSGAARWQWQHSISPVEELRYSITFRTLRAADARKSA